MVEDPLQRQRFLASLDARVGVLEDALSRLGTDDATAAAATVRRIADLLATAAPAAGFPALRAPARAVTEASEGELPDAVGGLLSALARAFDPSGDGASARVLVVERDPEIAHLVEVLVEDLGHAVVHARTGEEALSRLESAVPDLVVIDLVLPDRDGRQLLVSLRERAVTSAVPALVLGSPTSDGVREECLALGAEGYLEKPVDPEALAEAVEEILRAAAHEEHEATRDPRTGLLNRAGVHEAFEAAGTEGGGDAAALAVVELDGFASVESGQDARVADAVLAGAGRAIDDAVAGAGGRAGRWHGAEFVVVFDAADVDAAGDAARAAVRAIPAVSFVGTDGETFRVTASAAFVVAEPGEELAETLESARACVDRARADGGNRLAEEGREEGAERPGLLVAEDDPVMARLLVHRLEREGYDVTLHGNGADAHEAALERTYDLVILDAGMPGMGGFELLSRLRNVAAYADVPIVLLTAMGREDDLVRGFDIGADDYMLKPFSPVELAARVRRLLKARSASQAR